MLDEDVIILALEAAYHPLENLLGVRVVSSAVADEHLPRVTATASLFRRRSDRVRRSVIDDPLVPVSAFPDQGVRRLLLFAARSGWSKGIIRPQRQQPRRRDEAMEPP